MEFTTAIVVDSELVEPRIWLLEPQQGRSPYEGRCYGRDYVGDIVTDIQDIKKAIHAHTVGSIKHTRGIEVGQINLQARTKYSKSDESSTYKDENGEDQIYWMGCCRLALQELYEAIVEQSHDDRASFGQCQLLLTVIVTVINPRMRFQMDLTNKVSLNLKISALKL